MPILGIGKVNISLSVDVNITPAAIHYTQETFFGGI